MNLSRLRILTLQAVLCGLLISCVPYVPPSAGDFGFAVMKRPGRPVIVLPGFAASRLWDPVTERYVWGTAHASMQTRFADNLDLPVDGPADEIGYDRLIAQGWVGYNTPINIARQFVTALEHIGHYSTTGGPDGPPNLYPFYYDWRLSYTDNARDLDHLIEQIRREHGDPDLKVDLVGYSAGGMVALTYLKIGTASVDRPDQWDASSRIAAAKIGKAVLIAAPQRGVVDSLRVLHTGERFVFRSMTPGVISTYRSLTELLPADGKVLIDENGHTINADVWDLATWEKLGLSIFSEEHRRSIEAKTSRAHLEQLTEFFAGSLRRARKFRDAMQRPLPPTVEVEEIAADCVPTTRRVLRRADGSLAFYEHQLRAEERHLAPIMFEPGDGSVPLRSSTVNRGAAALIFCDEHQQYGRDESVRRAVVRALQPRTGQGSDAAAAGAD